MILNIHDKLSLTVNVSDHALVKLTDTGRARYRDWMGDQRLPRGDPPAPNAEGWTSFPLWELMAIFGPGLYNGMKSQFFEGNLIRLEHS